MKKIFLTIFISIFIVLSSFAQNVSFETVCKNLSSHSNMTGNFTQLKTISAINRTLKSTGTFIFSLEGIMWKTEKPFPSTLAVGMTQVIQTKADGSQNVIDASQNQIFTSISSTLRAMFGGDVDTLKKDFNIEFSTSGQTWNAILTPKDKVVSSVLKSISVSGNFTQNSSELNKIVMTESSDDTITYSFSNQKYPKELTADEKSYFTAK